MKAFKSGNWRLVWYSVLIWLLAIVVSSVVVLPWFYLALPLVVFWTTAFYFRSGQRNLVNGLRVSLFWFVLVGILSILEIAGPYYFNVFYYLSDQRNWLLYSLILLTPVIYSIILENKSKVRRKRREKSLVFPVKDPAQI